MENTYDICGSPVLCFCLRDKPIAERSNRTVGAQGLQCGDDKDAECQYAVNSLERQIFEKSDTQQTDNPSRQDQRGGSQSSKRNPQHSPAHGKQGGGVDGDAECPGNR